jgi:hypothetical protein
MNNVRRSTPSLLPLLSVGVLAGKQMWEEEEGKPRASGKGQAQKDQGR